MIPIKDKWLKATEPEVNLGLQLWLVSLSHVTKTILV